MDRCFASIDELENAETFYARKQESSEEYVKLKKFIGEKGNKKYKKYYIYSISDPGNLPYHFVAKFRSEDEDLKLKDLYLSHYSQGLNLLSLRDKEKNKPPSYPYYENEYVTLIKEGEFEVVPSAEDIYHTVLLWWYQNDHLKRTTTFPGSCSGVVSCVIGKYDNIFNGHAIEKRDQYLQELKKRPGNPFQFIQTKRKRKSPSFRAINPIKSNRKTVRKVKKSKKSKKSKSPRKFVKKSKRKSVKKVKKSKKTKKSKTPRKSRRITVRKLKSRK